MTWGSCFPNFWTFFSEVAFAGSNTSVPAAVLRLQALLFFGRGRLLFNPFTFALGGAGVRDAPVPRFLLVALLAAHLHFRANIALYF